jgi:hypothetical protein
MSADSLLEEAKIEAPYQTDEVALSPELLAHSWVRSQPVANCCSLFVDPASLRCVVKLVQLP